METVKAFLAIAAMIGGAVILLALPYNGFFWDYTDQAFVGVMLLAGGLTYMWKHSRFRKPTS